MAEYSGKIPVVQIDNRKGIQLAIDHLITTKRQRIAFISGPDSHSDAGERSQSYSDIIASYHEPVIAETESAKLFWHRGYECS